MILLPSDYAQASAYEGESGPRLVPGGYVCRMTGARMETVKTRNGEKDKLVIAYDIAEGEYAGHFDRLFKAARTRDAQNAKWKGTYEVFILKNTGETNPYFKGTITSIEKSNPGFSPVQGSQLNEALFKGRMIGLLLREEEFMAGDGQKKKAVKACMAQSVDKIRSGEFEIPAPVLLSGGSGSAQASATAAAGSGFTQVDDDELPF